MSRLGGELGVTAMSLYRYVETKRDLLTGMAERVLEDLDLPAEPSATSDWRAVALRIVYAWADLVTRHPGSIRLVYLDRPVTALDMRPVEHFASAALAAGFSPAQAALAYRTIVLYVDSVLMTATVDGDAGHASWSTLPADLVASLPGVVAIAPFADRLTYLDIFDHGVRLLLAGISDGLSSSVS